MIATLQQIPYADRHMLTSSGFALIWPFTNVARQQGPYELFLDNNALTNPRWVDELPTEVRIKAIINPWLALCEQWLSNHEFRNTTENRIREFIQPFSDRGFVFPAGFAKTQAKLLALNDQQIRTQWSLPYFHLAILKKLVDDKRGASYGLNELRALSAADVPRLNACNMLGALLLYLKGKQSLRFESDKKPAFSYLESFFAFQPETKHEPKFVSQAYLRNRAGDLALWYLVPMLMQHRFEKAGEPVVVTQDKALHRVLFKVLPAAYNPEGTVSSAPDVSDIDDVMGQDLFGIFKSVCAPIRMNIEAGEQLQRMQNLWKLTKQYATTPEEEKELDEVWESWYKPGHGAEFTFR